MTRRALIGMGIGQCLNWAVLYYAFAVLVLPLQRELAVETWVVTGAFSVALLMSAMLAPAVGRWGDSGRSGMVMQTGGVAGAILLVAWTMLPGVMGLYIAWMGLGLCMAATLYEPVFVIVARSHDDPATRLRALAVITLLGGLASTVSLPATAFLTITFGWRTAVVALAAVLAASTWLIRQSLPQRSGYMPAGPSAETPWALAWLPSFART
jgi:MFS family permease